MKILLVEPNKPLGNVYKKALTKAGHDVTLSRDAQAAVYEADQSTPDMVVLELQLPGHGGVEFLYEFRSYPEWRNIPIVLHTFVAEADIILPSQLNVALHLYKPSTSLKQLVRAVNEISSVAVG
jgi:DNA-binding response OmpR family regulator